MQYSMKQVQEDLIHYNIIYIYNYNIHMINWWTEDSDGFASTMFKLQRCGGFAELCLLI